MTTIMHLIVVFKCVFVSSIVCLAKSGFLDLMMDNLSQKKISYRNYFFFAAIPDPASVTGVASAALEYASDTDSEEEITTLPRDILPRREADSELDSADSDADPLEHAQVFTTEEITRIYLEKLQRLKVNIISYLMSFFLKASNISYISTILFIIST